MARRSNTLISHPPEIEPEHAQLLDSIADMMLDRKYSAQGAPRAAGTGDEQSGNLRTVLQRSAD